MAGMYPDFVIPDMLATSTDYTNWTGGPAPNNVNALLRSATMRVLEATAGAYYQTDPTTGLATETQIINALRDATCIQAAAWAAIGYDPLTGGVVTSNIKSSKALGTAKITYADSQAAADARAAAIEGLVPDAATKLLQANLLSTRVWLYG